MNPRTIDALALLEAAVCQDDARSETLAVAAGADPHALPGVGQMAAVPLLQAGGRGVGGEGPGSWWGGDCPLCGAWAGVAGYAGVEGQRPPRCGGGGTGG